MAAPRTLSRGAADRGSVFQSYSERRTTAARNLLRRSGAYSPYGGPKPSFHSRVTSDVTPDDSVSAPAAPLDMTPTLGWEYDCAHCGARVRGLDTSTLIYQRCLAPVTSRAIPTVRELQVQKLARPAAA